MVRAVVLKSNGVNRVNEPLKCVGSGPVELYLSVDDYKTLETTISRLFDAESVERIKDALKAGR
jgi:hypothetical protein